MKLWTRRSGSKTVHSEEWFSDLYSRMPIPDKNYPHVGGPGDDFLRQVAFGPKKPALSDPRTAHVADCPYCLQRIAQLRQEPATKRVPFIPVAAFAMAVLLVLVSLGWHSWKHRSATAQLAANSTLDLTAVSATRGASLSQQPLIHLPRRPDVLTILLPLFSDGGQYTVQILPDKTKPEAVAAAQGVAAQSGNVTSLKVEFDLSHVQPGVYYLATVHGTDEATYYYPIAVND